MPFISCIFQKEFIHEYSSFNYFKIQANSFAGVDRIREYTNHPVISHFVSAVILEVCGIDTERVVLVRFVGRRLSVWTSAEFAFYSGD